MIKEYKLIIDYRKDNEFLTIGFKGVKLNLDGSRGNGVILAHDLLEHGPFEKIGPVAEEHEALGSMLFIRGDHQINGRPPEQYLAHIITMLSTFAKRYGIRGEVPDQQECEALDKIDEILELARLNYKGEDFDFERYLADARKLISAGYNRAKEFWKGNKERAYQLFQEVERVASVNPKDYEHLKEYTLKVNYKTLEVILK